MGGTGVCVILALVVGTLGLAAAVAALVVAVGLWAWVPPVRSVEREREG